MIDGVEDDKGGVEDYIEDWGPNRILSVLCASPGDRNFYKEFSFFPVLVFKLKAYC
jgi:hypothetical protein